MKNDADSLIEFTFLGQDGFRIKVEGHCFLIDPYLSEYVVESGIGSAESFSRQFPAPLQVEDLLDVDTVFVTHDHGDHLDPLTLIPLYQANPLVHFICPKPAFTHLVSLGVDPSRITIPEIGTLYERDGLVYYAVPAAHYQFERDEKDGAYTYFGFVIKLGTRWLYHAGDTILYDGMIEEVLRYTEKIDLACLPVNGRDGWRERMGMTGNLDGAEALELAQKLKAEVLFPMHNDLFKVNHVNPAILADLLDRRAPRQKVHWLQPGEKYFYLK
jgi:L-ascorbate 6-phosphate lactonase